MKRGAFPLFRVAGVRVYLHFSWFIVAWYEIASSESRYHWRGWAAVEYMAIFGVILLHELGHALACRSTGGRADEIVLWPLGGLAFVDPPPRATAVLWSIAAGPLVNVVLFPILLFFAILTGPHGWLVVAEDVHHFLWFLCVTNLVVLIFNLLPFYPLDGGQIVRALLWFKIGPIRSLRVAAVIGIFGALVLGLLAWYIRDIWTGVIAFFLFSQASGAVARTKEMRLEEELALNKLDPPPGSGPWPPLPEPRE